MHVCFPFRLNANTANTHHQALGECRAKGSGELKAEVKQQMLFMEKKTAHVHILYYSGFSTSTGPLNVFIPLRTDSPDSDGLLCHCTQCHILYKAVIHFRDGSSSPWAERRGRFYICLVVINSTFGSALITAAPAPVITPPNIRHPFMGHFCRTAVLQILRTASSLEPKNTSLLLSVPT